MMKPLAKTNRPSISTIQPIFGGASRSKMRPRREWSLLVAGAPVIAYYLARQLCLQALSLTVTGAEARNIERRRTNTFAGISLT